MNTSRRTFLKTAGAVGAFNLIPAKVLWGASAPSNQLTRALIGFAGRRVIENTIKQKLPADFQSAEYLEKHGFVDKIVERKDMKAFIAKMLNFWGF